MASAGQFSKEQLAELKALIDAEVAKKLASYQKNPKSTTHSSTWNPFTVVKNYFQPTSHAQETPQVTPPPQPATKARDIIFHPPMIPIAMEMFDQFVATYPHYNLDPWEFHFGLLAANQQARDRYGVLKSAILDSFVGLIPTYRHLRSLAAKLPHRPELISYSEYLDEYARFAGYCEHVITPEKLGQFLDSFEGKQITANFRGYRDDCFGVLNAGGVFDGGVWL